MTDDLTQALNRLLAALAGLSPDERVEVIDDIASVYCPECGREQSGGRCRCWDDE